jgi:hypothetical protein
MKRKRYFLAGYRLAFGLLALLAIVVQFAEVVSKFGFSPTRLINFLSFFTIEANVFAAIMLLIAGWCALHPKSRPLDLLRGSATLYMTITGIVYVLLLSGLEKELQTTIPWVNFVLHYLMPVVVLSDWFADLPTRRLAFKQALTWIIFPLLYLTYSLLRGLVVHWYPYPFLDPAHRGYIGVAVISFIIAGAMLVFIRLFAWSSLLRPRARPPG